MILIFYSGIKNFFTDDEMNVIKRYFNTEMISRVEKSRSSLYKNRRTTFMCMMFQVCRSLKIPFSSLKTIYHNNCGKLMMSRYNIEVSYSGDYVFCMLTNFKVGFDAELINSEISENEYKVFNHFFKTDIKEYLTFFKEWTRLESIVKYFDNKGMKDFIYKQINTMGYGLETIHIALDGKYIIAISAPKLLSIKEKIKFKHL